MAEPDRASASRILVLGECLADVAPAPPAPPAECADRGTFRHLVAMPGGSPANVALGLARLGQYALFAGRFSSSGLGPWLRGHLAENGVDLSASVAADEPATIALVTLDEHGAATYAFYGPETADWHWRADELPSPVRLGAGPGRVAAVHTGSLAAAFTPGADLVGNWMGELKRSGQVLVSFDPNVRPGLTGGFDHQRERLSAMTANAHLIKASHEDVSAIFPGDGPEHAAEHWLAGGALAVVITKGAEGATLFHRKGHRATGAPPPVAVVDTIGAGDAFTAGLLAYFGRHGLLSPEGLGQAGPSRLSEALGYALAVSALTCTRAGADPPFAEEVEAYAGAISLPPDGPGPGGPAPATRA